MPRTKKIPLGAGSFFVLSAKTIRFPIMQRPPGMRDLPDGLPAAFDLLVNTSGYGSVVAVPTGETSPRPEDVRRIDALQAVDILRRTNVDRLHAGLPTLDIPAALIKRAKSETAPGMAALVAFPGELKRYFEGRGSWADTGLWVSFAGEYQLEMRSSTGYVRKRLSEHDGEQWLEANGHPRAMHYINTTPSKRGTDRLWSIVTKKTATEVAKKTAEQVKREQRIRAAIAKAPAATPPKISPPKKQRTPRRGK